MGKRSRRRQGARERPPATDYTDADGNVLSLRDSISGASLEQLRDAAGGAGASGEDLWRRRTEMLFERLAVRWVIAGLPLEKQSELLGRYRMADQETQAWVRATVDAHLEKLG